jgi:hypothetical protein
VDIKRRATVSESSRSTGLPARGYVWENFTAGNEAALTHGAWSDRKVSPVAAEFLQGVLAQVQEDPQFEHLATPMFRPALRAWARCEARIELLSTWLDAKQTDLVPGDLDSEEELRPAAMLLARLEGQALKHRAQLGMDPLSFARLRRDAGSAVVSFDLAKLLADLDAAGRSGPAGGPERERDADHGE